MTTNWTTGSFYKFEPLILNVTAISGTSLSLGTLIIDGTSYTFSASYVPTSGSVRIDLTELARMASASLSFILTDSAGSKTISATYAGDADPLTFIAPESWQRSALADAVGDSHLNYPLPSMMVGGSANVQAEVIFAASDDIQVTEGGAYEDGLVTVEESEPLVAYYVNTSDELTVRMAKQECGVRYALVSWRSRMGREKRHYWEVVEVTENTSETQDIETLDRSYDVRKDKLVTLTLRLRGLDAYDVWYYSDIINSSSVTVNIDENERAVEVTTKKSVMPDGNGGKLNELEVEVNYKRYEVIG